MSVVGVTLICFNGSKLSNNIGLRKKVQDLIISKWGEYGIETINPPFNTAYSDYLEQCHVKIPKNKVVIEPESKRTLKQLQQKVQQTHEYSFNK